MAIIDYMRFIHFNIARKMMPFILVGFVVIIFSLTSNSFGQSGGRSKDHKKLFLYASSLPITLENQYYILRKHVVDVILSTQLFDLVFSEIPDYLAPSTTKQFILKYKLRTDGKHSYKLELYLIDADAVQIVRNVIHNKINKDNLIYDFRLKLYEFILNRKLTPKAKVTFQKKSLKIRQKIAKQKLHMRKPPKLKKLPLNISKLLNKPAEIKPLATANKPINKNTPSNELKPSLWELLKDDDIDVPWIPIEKVKRSYKTGTISLAPVKKINPFSLWADLSLKTTDELSTSLISHQFHLAWKYVQRELIVDDLLKIQNEFYSILGFTAEWLYHFPIHISRLVFRAGMEIDQTLKTEPLDMNGHFVFRTGFGYMYNSWLMPSLYYEQSHINYANLNVVGQGLEANTHSIKWLSLEVAILGNKTYLSGHFAHSIASSYNGDPRELSAPTGFRYGANLRYFFNNKLFGAKYWFDVEYRKESFNRENVDGTMTLDKSEYSMRLGIHF